MSQSESDSRTQSEQSFTLIDHRHLIVYHSEPEREKTRVYLLAPGLLIVERKTRERIPINEWGDYLLKDKNRRRG